MHKAGETLFIDKRKWEKIHKSSLKTVCEVSKQLKYKQTQRKIVYKYAEQDKIAQ